MANPDNTRTTPTDTTTKPKGSAALHHALDVVESFAKGQTIEALSSRLDSDLSTVEVGAETLSCIMSAFPSILRSGEGLQPSLMWVMDKLAEDVAALRASYHKLNCAILAGRAGA